MVVEAYQKICSTEALLVWPLSKPSADRQYFVSPFVLELEVFQGIGIQWTSQPCMADSLCICCNRICASQKLNLDYHDLFSLVQ